MQALFFYAFLSLKIRQDNTLHFLIFFQKAKNLHQKKVGLFGASLIYYVKKVN